MPLKGGGLNHGNEVLPCRGAYDEMMHDVELCIQPLVGARVIIPHLWLIHSVTTFMSGIKGSSTSGGVNWSSFIPDCGSINV